MGFADELWHALSQIDATVFHEQGIVNASKDLQLQVWPPHKSRPDGNKEIHLLKGKYYLFSALKLGPAPWRLFKGYQTLDVEAKTTRQQEECIQVFFEALNDMFKIPGQCEMGKLEPSDQKSYLSAPHYMHMRFSTYPGPTDSCRRRLRQRSAETEGTPEGIERSRHRSPSGRRKRRRLILI